MDCLFLSFYRCKNREKVREKSAQVVKIDTLTFSKNVKKESGYKVS